MHAPSCFFFTTTSRQATFSSHFSGASAALPALQHHNQTHVLISRGPSGVHGHSTRHATLAYPESAMCVQSFDDSRDPAIRITYRISLRSSSLWEPRHPLLKVVRHYIFVCFTHFGMLSAGLCCCFTKGRLQYDHDIHTRTVLSFHQLQRKQVFPLASGFLLFLFCYVLRGRSLSFLFLSLPTSLNIRVKRHTMSEEQGSTT